MNMAYATILDNRKSWPVWCKSSTHSSEQEEKEAFTLLLINNMINKHQRSNQRWQEEPSPQTWNY